MKRPSVMIVSGSAVHSATYEAFALEFIATCLLGLRDDRVLLEPCADRLWLVAGGRVSPFDGDMDDYRRFLLEERKPASSKEPKDNTPRLTKAEERKVAADRRALVAPLRKASDEAEKRVAKLQMERAKAENALNASDIHEMEPARVTALSKLRADLTRQIESAEANWLAALESYETAKGAKEA